MSGHGLSDPPSSSSTLALGLRIDKQCLLFEDRWRAGDRPRIEDFLEQVAEPDRLPLLKELLGLEIDLRREAGESPYAGEYRERFADHRGTIDAVVHEEMASSSGSPASPSVAGDLPDRLGDYRILRQAGRGAMGIVYEAEHETLGQRVAIKVLPPHCLLDPTYIKRFHREARAAASLHHTNIVSVFGVGEHDGIHFYVMQFVDGLSLDQVIQQLRGDREFNATSNATAAENLLSGSSSGRAYWRSVAKFGVQIARALAYAHAHGILHRDVKPSNLLVDSDGTAWIADFGLARVEGHDDLTRTTDLVGTLLYMAPERLNGICDRTSDVYSLGLTLYELLTLEPAFKASSREQLLEQVLTSEPPRPRSLNPSVPADLETICLRSIQKNPSRRYASADDLALDLQLWLENKPIRARRVGSLERIARWSHRNPLLAATLAAMFVVFATAFATISWSYVRTEAALREEEKQRKSAVTAREEAHHREHAERWERYRANMSAAASGLQLHNVIAVQEALDAAPPEHRSWEWRYFTHQLDMAHRVLRGPNKIQQVRFSPDGRTVALLNNSLPLRLYDAIEGKEIGPLPNMRPGYYLRFSSDGRMIAFPSYHMSDPNFYLRDLSADHNRTLEGHQKHGWIARFDPAGDLVATGSDDRTIRLWDVASGKLLRVLEGHGDVLRELAFSPDGSRLASASDDQTVRLWDVETGETVAVLDGHAAKVIGVIYSPQGDRLLSVEDFPENSLHLWDAATGRRIAKLSGHTNQVNSFTFSPDGTQIATGSWDWTARLWDGKTGALTDTLRGHRGCVNSVAFSPDGTRLISGAWDQTVRVWDVETTTLMAILLGHKMDVHGATYTADGKWIVSCSIDAEIRVWDAAGVERQGGLRGHSSFVYDVAFHPDGSRVASASWDGTARIWNATSGETLAVLNVPDQAIVASVAFHPGGQLVATLSRDDKVRLWDLETAAEVHAFDVPTNWYHDSRLAFSPSGDLLATGSYDQGVYVWDVNRRSLVARMEGHTDCIHGLVFSTDGSWLASAGEQQDKSVRIWDMNTHQQICDLMGHTAGVYSLAVSPKGSLLASGSRDGTVRLWDTVTWKEAGILQHGSPVFGLSFSPDGKRLAAACANGTIRLWDVARRQSVGELHGHSDYVNQVAYSPDGSRLISASGDSTARIWDSLSPQERAAVSSVSSSATK